MKQRPDRSKVGDSGIHSPYAGLLSHCQGMTGRYRASVETGAVLYAPKHVPNSLDQRMNLIGHDGSFRSLRIERYSISKDALIGATIVTSGDLDRRYSSTNEMTRLAQRQRRARIVRSQFGRVTSRDQIGEAL